MALRFGRYETLEPIASGGMAKVYRGRAVAAGGFERIVAIKVMHPHLAADPDFVDMFLDEARFAARVQHPNVVSTHDVQRSPLGTFLVMDYVDGIDLGLLLRCYRTRSQRLPMEASIRILLDVLSGLGAAHELTTADGRPLHFVHRDISPQNVLLDRHTGVARLTDFGVAHARERLGTTHSGELKGKIGYVSPEHARGAEVDRRSDLYACGVLFWELLTGRQMFAGRSRARRFADILSGAVKPPALVCPDVPVALSEVCLKAVHLNPKDRYQTAQEFAVALRRAARSSQLAPAEHDAIAALIAAARAEPFLEETRRRLDQEEETLTDFATARSGTKMRFDSPYYRRPPPRRRLGSGAALGLIGAALAAVILSPWMTEESEPREPFGIPSEQTVSFEPLPTQMFPPGHHESVVERVPRRDDEASDMNKARMPRSVSRDSSLRMYHPRGL